MILQPVDWLAVLVPILWAKGCEPMKRWSKAVVGSVAVCLLLQMCAFAGNSEGIRERVVRLHVLAHSDSEDEQALKLKVRDAVAQEAAVLVGNETQREAMLACLRDNLPRLRETAQRCVDEAGYAHTVKAELTAMYFTTREYDSGTYPAGVYDALRITIGDGAGRNWWCVLYPPLCVAASTRAVTAEQVLTDGQLAVVNTPKYAVRFKLVEWWERLVSS